jgi:hypothetical protein
MNTLLFKIYKFDNILINSKLDFFHILRCPYILYLSTFLGFNLENNIIYNLHFKN